MFRSWYDSEFGIFQNIQNMHNLFHRNFFQLYNFSKNTHFINFSHIVINFYAINFL